MTGKDSELHCSGGVCLKKRSTLCERSVTVGEPSLTGGMSDEIESLVDSRSVGPLRAGWVDQLRPEATSVIISIRVQGRVRAGRARHDGKNAQRTRRARVGVGHIPTDQSRRPDDRCRQLLFQARQAMISETCCALRLKAFARARSTKYCSLQLDVTTACPPSRSGYCQLAWLRAVA